MSWKQRLLLFWHNVAYTLTALFVSICNRFRHFKSSSVFAWFDGLRTRVRQVITNQHRGRNSINKLQTKGKQPKEPKVLGCVLVQKSFASQDVQAICRLLEWARHKNFQLCTLYCPFDGLNERYQDIQDSLQWSDPHTSIDIWTGWRPSDSWLESMKQQPGTQDRTRMGVAVLMAHDAEEPLAIISSSGISKYQIGGDNMMDALQRAMMAPQVIKKAVHEVAGPVASMDPDIIMIFGSVQTLGGFPSWATRSSEMYEMGHLSAVTRGKLDAAYQKFLKTKQRFGT